MSLNHGGSFGCPIHIAESGVYHELLQANRWTVLTKPIYNIDFDAIELIVVRKYRALIDEADKKFCRDRIGRPASLQSPFL